MTQTKTTTYHAGTLYRQTGPRKSRKWQMRLTTADGTRRSLTTGTADEDEARRILALTLGDVAAGRPIPARGKDAVTIEDGVALIRADYTRRNRKSIHDIIRRIDRHVRPFFGGATRLDAITSKQIRAFGELREREGSTPSNINREFDALSKMFTLAMRDPEYAYLRRPYFPRYSEAGRTRQGFFEERQVTAMRRHLPDYWQGVLTFAYITGWRVIAEILTLEWWQVDRDACVIRLPAAKSKNGKGRVLAYGEHPALMAVIEAQWRARLTLAHRGVITPLVFTADGRPLFIRPCKHKGQPIPEAERAKGKPSMADFMREAWRRARVAAGLPRDPHDFRRTAVRNLSRAHVPDTIADAITGHLTDAVRKNYDIVNEADIAKGLGLVATMHTRKRGAR